MKQTILIICFLVLAVLGGLFLFRQRGASFGATSTHTDKGTLDRLVVDYLQAPEMNKPGQHEDKEIVGGRCEYVEYQGKAVITSIVQREEDFDSFSNDSYIIKFHFTPQTPIVNAVSTKDSYDNELKVNGSQFPSAEFIARHGIAEGKEFDCVLQMIKKGACTPIIYTFPKINLGEM